MSRSRSLLSIHRMMASACRTQEAPAWLPASCRGVSSIDSAQLRPIASRCDAWARAGDGSALGWRPHGGAFRSLGELGGDAVPQGCRGMAKKAGKGGSPAGSRRTAPGTAPDAETEAPGAAVDWSQGRDHMERAVAHMEKEFRSLQSTRASEGLLDHLQVEAYGVTQGLRGLASVLLRSQTTLAVTPFDAATKSAIVAAIRASPLGLTVEESGGEVLVRLPLPTKEHMGEMVRVARVHAEHTRTVLRHERQRLRDAVKKAGMTQDETKEQEKRVQEMRDTYLRRVEERLKEKEAQLMSV